MRRSLWMRELNDSKAGMERTLVRACLAVAQDATANGVVCLTSDDMARMPRRARLSREDFDRAFEEAQETRWLRLMRCTSAGAEIHLSVPD